MPAKPILMARNSFTPNAPGRNLWLIAVILGGLGILARQVPMDVLSRYNYALLLIGFLLLVLGTASRRM